MAGILLAVGFSIRRADAWAIVPLIGTCLWALISTSWTPYHAGSVWESTPVKLTGETLLYLSAYFGWRHLPESLARLAAKILAISVAALAVVLVVETLTDGLLYKTWRVYIGQAMRPDLAIRNASRALYPLALFTPAAALAAGRAIGRPSLGLLMVIAASWASLHFGYDAPLLALVAGIVAGGAVFIAPRAAPIFLGILSTIYFILAPVAVDLMDRTIVGSRLAFDFPLSWQERLGYWRVTTHLIWQKPIIGWGLDASRTFGPGIQLHPHNGALQIWLELGGVGALFIASFWVFLFWNLWRPQRNISTAAGAATAAIYLAIGAVSFGVWQEWWLACGMIAAIACQLAGTIEPRRTTFALPPRHASDPRELS